MPTRGHSASWIGESPETERSAQPTRNPEVSWHGRPGPSWPCGFTLLSARPIAAVPRPSLEKNPEKSLNYESIRPAAKDNLKTRLPC